MGKLNKVWQVIKKVIDISEKNAQKMQNINEIVQGTENVQSYTKNLKNNKSTGYLRHNKQTVSTVHKTAL